MNARGAEFEGIDFCRQGKNVSRQFIICFACCETAEGFNHWSRADQSVALFGGQLVGGAHQIVRHGQIFGKDFCFSLGQACGGRKLF